MSDGQFYCLILAAETVIVLAGWWAWKRLQLRRSRRQWIDQLEARQRQHTRTTTRKKAS